MEIMNMGIDKKIGQMMMAGFPSSHFDRHAQTMIEKYFIGNAILFARNVGEKAELVKLNSDLQDSFIKHTGIPGFISIDQEGGMVTRIQEWGTFLPGNMALSASGGPDYAYEEGRIAGKELRALGINMNLAPVLDVNNNPANPVIGIRSYSDSPQRVSEFGTAYIRGIQENGVIATGKHFPGHGDTDMDSHRALPSVNHDMQRLEKIELRPFVQAVNCGIDAIMTAHVLFPAIEENKLPATLSAKVLTGLLRGKMGFEGLIVTDSILMSAVADNFGSDNAAVMAVKAGADIICISGNLDMQIKCVDKIKAAVMSGEISLNRIDEAVERILHFKRKYGIFDMPYPDAKRAEELVGCAEHVSFAEKISEKSITLLKDTKNLIPLRCSNPAVISAEPLILTGVDDQYKKRRLLCQALTDSIGGSSYSIPVDPDGELIDSLVCKVKGADTVIIGTYNANLNEGQVKLVKKILEFQENVIVISLRNPYDILKFEDVPACLCAYEYTPLSVKSVIKVLTGKIPPEGKLPVKLS